MYIKYFHNTAGRWFINVYRKPNNKIVGIPYARYVMEQHLGRLLETWEIVHHKDENKLNDELSNLEVMHNSIHIKSHMIGKKKNYPSAYPGALLTIDQVTHYREAYAQKKMSAKAIAAEAGVKIGTVYNFLSWRSYTK